MRQNKENKSDMKNLDKKENTYIREAFNIYFIIKYVKKKQKLGYKSELPVHTVVIMIRKVKFTCYLIKTGHSFGAFLIKCALHCTSNVQNLIAYKDLRLST